VDVLKNILTSKARLRIFSLFETTSSNLSRLKETCVKFSILQVSRLCGIGSNGRF
jgi:hypothetical protein